MPRITANSWIINAFHSVGTHEGWQSSLLQKWAARLCVIYNSRLTLPLIVLLGIGSAAVALIAYAPAHGADAMDYYLHAAVLAGKKISATFMVNPPIYPLLVDISYFQLNSLYILIVFQLVLSVLQGPFFYLAVRPYSPALAFVTALVVTGDMQMRVLYNFTSTEPVYMTLLAIAFYLLTTQMALRNPRGLLKTVLLGVILVLLAYTRTVGRYLFLPITLVFLLKTRSFKHIGVLIAVVLVGQQVFSFGYRLVSPTPVQTTMGTANDILIALPIYRSDLLEAENGPASERLLQLQVQCEALGPEGDSWLPVRCMAETIGSSDALMQLFQDVFIEMMRKHPFEYARGVFGEITKFLKLTGNQYTMSPASVQCADIEQSVDENMIQLVDIDILSAGLNNVDRETMRELIDDFTRLFCPHWPESAHMRDIVNAVAEQYRSISRPHPWLWYGALALVVLVIPVARRYWPLALSSALILLYHAGVNGMIYSVQPRYVVVANPFKAILLVILAYIIGRLVLRAVDEILARREQAVAQHPNTAG